ncbi:TPA: ead/Ea22-like family protein [Salmonella enterica]
MSNIDKQALRQIAESVDREEWDVLDNGDADYQVIVSGSLERGATYRSYQPVTYEISNKKIAAFIAAFNPKVALALLDELDKKQQYIKLRDQENEDIALTVGKLRVELEHYKSREERVTKLVLDNSTSWDVLYEKLEATERRIANNERVMRAVVEAASIRGIRPFEGIECDPPTLEENAEACGDAMSARIRELEANPPKPHHNGLMQISNELVQARQRIAELEAKLETADRLQDSAFRDGLKAGFSYGQTDDQSGFAQCMSAYSTRAGIGVKQQEDSVDSDVGSRNYPGMVVAVHIGAGDFVKVKGQVFEVEETDFDDHDVTLWFVGGNALKCAAGCPVEVVSAPVAAGIKVKEL